MRNPLPPSRNGSWARPALLDLAPAAALALGFAATAVAAATEHAVYSGMRCDGARSVPGTAAAFYTLGVACGIVALTVALWPRSHIDAGPMGAVRARVGGWLTVGVAVVTVVAGSCAGPRDQHGRDPIAGPWWLVELVVSMIVASTMLGCVQLWRSRGQAGSRLGLLATTTLGVLISASTLGALTYHDWFAAHALHKVCWYG
ncbi:hypothetical protein ACFXHA_25595 [Nocardia sp. NPDC059240]|uniref:hypothetical protein n=1 Tax=Nocardia sp. NPDC059240 TaxID=3346786 RepID=UPI0036B1C631